MTIKNLLCMILLYFLLIFTKFSTNAFMCEQKDLDVNINDEECSMKQRFTIDLDNCLQISPNNGKCNFLVPLNKFESIILIYAVHDI